MFLVALTGPIASGKSTVAARLVEHGAVEVDADILARIAVQPGSDGLAKIAARWPEVILADGSLDRAKLGGIVFSDATQRAELEAIVHPEVKRLAVEAFSNHAPDAIVLYTVPLLVEANVDHDFDLVVTVEAPEPERIRRLESNRGMAHEEAIQRVRSQASPAARANRADVIVNSNQSIDSMLRDVDALWDRIKVLAAEKSKS
ncbi:MAG: hypothetical protein RLZZ400_631 [Actinomycetota bacterium]